MLKLKKTHTHTHKRKSVFTFKNISLTPPSLKITVDVKCCNCSSNTVHCSYDWKSSPLHELESQSQTVLLCKNLYCGTRRQSVFMSVSLVFLVWPFCGVLHSRLLFDPGAVFSDRWVDARFVPPSTAITPTDHSCQEWRSAGRAGQRTARVPLTETNTGARVKQLV